MGEEVAASRLRAGNLTSADFIRENGWAAGDILRGGPIMHGTVQVEPSKVMRITAVGESAVLGRSLIHGIWSPENVRNFNARDWTLAESEQP